MRYNSYTYATHSVLLLVFLALYSISCREKDTVTGPDPGPTGDWSLVLRHPQKLHSQGNDTITVRVYNPQGYLASGVNVRSRADSGINVVTASATTLIDTLQSWWGCNPAMFYWGEGLTSHTDTIRSWAIQVGTGDTLASTVTWFEVVP